MVDGVFKEKDELKQIFEAHGVDLSKETVHYCNSGNTACIM